jgi:hypothetical protein
MTAEVLTANRLQNSRKIFQDVSETFRNSLPPMEKALFREFDDPRFMIKQLQEEVKAYPNGRKLAKLCSKVEGFASAMAPFFDIIAILVSSHPEFAALAWGAVRLVFLVWLAASCRCSVNGD